jgi:hypothetical protein
VGAPEKNLELANFARDSLTGLYLCCNAFTFQSNGSFTGLSSAEIAAQVPPLVSAGLDVHYVISVTAESISSQSWKGAAIEAAVQTAVQGGFAGYIVDYEPVTNYTLQHAQAYGDFLAALAAALHSESKELGFDIADWSILDFWSVYSTTGVDIATSMTPSYFGTNVTRNRDFFSTALASGMTKKQLGAGIGTMLVPPYVGMLNYNWTAPSLTAFATWLATSADINRMDFWRDDIDHSFPPNATESFVYDAARLFLSS